MTMHELTAANALMSARANEILRQRAASLAQDRSASTESLRAHARRHGVSQEMVGRAARAAGLLPASEHAGRIASIPAAAMDAALTAWRSRPRQTSAGGAR